MGFTRGIAEKKQKDTIELIEEFIFNTTF